jgi:hypothetical protein
MEQLLTTDEATTSCSSTGSSCPGWLTSELLSSTVRPALVGAAVVVNRATHEVSEASSEIKREVTLKNLDRLDAVQKKMERITEICKRVRPSFAPLSGRCDALQVVLSNASSVVSERAERVNEIRRKQAQAEAQERLRKVAITWRSHFGACRRLQEGIRQLDRVQEAGKCGAECAAVVTRMQSEQVRLRNFHTDQTVEDPTILDGLQKECESAGCETCP